MDPFFLAAVDTLMEDATNEQKNKRKTKEQKRTINENVVGCGAAAGNRRKISSREERVE